MSLMANSRPLVVHSGNCNLLPYCINSLHYCSIFTLVLPFWGASSSKCYAFGLTRHLLGKIMDRMSCPRVPVHGHTKPNKLGNINYDMQNYVFHYSRRVNNCSASSSGQSNSCKKCPRYMQFSQCFDMAHRTLVPSFYRFLSHIYNKMLMKRSMAAN